jgi:UDP-GlcNAc:undecaprenyl-phosphate GlcNAc-1-phosphate transferase
MLMDRWLVWLAVLVAVLAAGGIATMLRWHSHRLLDVPNVRSSHTRPIPRGGGLPVVASVLIAWSAWLAISHHLAPAALTVIACTIAVAAVSWIDDVARLSFASRLVVHVLAAVAVIVASPPPASVVLPGLGAITLGALAVPLSVFWIVGLTNAFNFMDGIDGIAGGQALIAGIAWAVVAAGWEPDVSAMGLFIAAGALAFLAFNWSPARIFMGDVGSASLGFLFAALALMRSTPERDGISWIVGAAFVWPFVFDATFTVGRRVHKRERLTEAHRSHLYQRLVIVGVSHALVTTLYMLWALMSAFLGAAIARRLAWSGLAALVWGAASGLLMWTFVVAMERRRAATRGDARA